MTVEGSWIDISVPLKTGMVHYPGDTPVRIERDSDMAKGDPVNVSRIIMSAHSGTHVDAPLHFLEKGNSIDHVPFDAMGGRARVIGIRDQESIGCQELESLRIDSGDILLFKTRNSTLWHQDGFCRDYVHLSTAAAVFLATKGVKTVGIDYLSVGGYERNEMEAHRTLLEASIWIVEGLDLSSVEPGIYDFMCLPLRLEGAEGAPARAVVRPVSSRTPAL
jgi:arylformamidase